MTEFGSSKIKRSIKIFGVEQPVNVELTAEGITFGVKGARKHTILSWHRALEASETETDVPSYLMGKPVQLLKWLAEKVGKREAAKTGHAAIN